MKKKFIKAQNLTNAEGSSSVLGKRRLDNLDVQTNDTTDETKSASASNHGSYTKGNSEMVQYSDNKSNYIFVGSNSESNTVGTINIKQKSKEGNYVYVNTDPDTIKLNLEQDSDKNNQLIINPKDSNNKNVPENKNNANVDVPQNKENANVDIPTKSQNDKHNKYENNKYESSTHNDATFVDISRPEVVNVSGTQYNNTENIDDKLNKLLALFKPENKTKNNSKNESKDDNSKSGGSGLSGSGPITGNDSGNESSSAGPSNFRTFLDKTLIILINITTSILDTINDILTIM